METNDGYSFSYSAKEQEELKAIKSKYVTTGAGEDKLARLRRLDKSVTGSATAVSLALGTVGALIMGFGMSLFMSDLASILGLGEVAAVAIGIPTGLIGMALVAVAYPVYSLVVKLQKKRLGPEIIALADELIK